MVVLKAKLAVVLHLSPISMLLKFVHDYKEDFKFTFYPIKNGSPMEKVNLRSVVKILALGLDKGDVFEIQIKKLKGNLKEKEIAFKLEEFLKQKKIISSF